MAIGSTDLTDLHPLLLHLNRIVEMNFEVAEPHLGTRHLKPALFLYEIGL